MFRRKRRRFRRGCSAWAVSGGVLAAHRLPDKLDEFGWGQRFKAEGNIEALVLLFGVRQAAEHDNGHFGVGFAEPADEIGTAGSGHQVIGDDEADLLVSAAQEG
jgi:hypothetical protein